MLARPAISLADRLELCRAEVTLDGAPAAICGALHEFATVVALPNGPRGQWDWASARDIVAAGGAFALGSRPAARLAAQRPDRAVARWRQARSN